MESRTSMGRQDLPVHTEKWIANLAPVGVEGRQVLARSGQSTSKARLYDTRRKPAEDNAINRRRSIDQSRHSRKRGAYHEAKSAAEV
jgi:hypothetical protein